MKIHVLRHAKTNVESFSGKDKDRKLSTKGIKQSKCFLKEKSKSITNVFVLCSYAQRTKETLSLIDIKENPFQKRHLEELYLASCSEIENIIREQKTEDDLFIIGHNFGLSDFVSKALFTDFYLKTCEYICLEVDIEKWEDYIEGIAIKIDSFRPTT